MAVVDDVDTGTPVLYQVHVDHLDRPVMMTDGSGAVVWRATYMPYGEVYSITGSESYDYRFPGQWFMLETGLTYNWNRWYDPTLGRYTQPDPIGLDGGAHRYAYAGNSPLMYVDPTGKGTSTKGELPHAIQRFGKPLRFYDMCGNASMDIDIPGNHGPGEFHLWNDGKRGKAIPFTLIPVPGS